MLAFRELKPARYACRQQVVVVFCLCPIQQNCGDTITAGISMVWFHIIKISRAVISPRCARLAYHHDFNSIMHVLQHPVAQSLSQSQPRFSLNSTVTRLSMGSFSGGSFSSGSFSSGSFSGGSACLTAAHDLIAAQGLILAH